MVLFMKSTFQFEIFTFYYIEDLPEAIADTVSAIADISVKSILIMLCTT